MDVIKILVLLSVTFTFSGCASTAPTESTSDEHSAEAKDAPAEVPPAKTLMDRYISGDIPGVQD